MLPSNMANPNDRDWDSRLLIGYWHDGNTRYTHPQSLVQEDWEPERRPQIIEYLKAGYTFAESMGYSYCRFGCTSPFLRRTDDPSRGEYREMKIPYFVITDGVSETCINDASGYYISELGPMANGCHHCCDDVWCWPEGLCHYVEFHGICLPEEFVAHAASRQFRPVDSVPNPLIRNDDRFWRAWCDRNAPFAHEPQCRACNPPARRT
jgi:hypothetical protein